MLNLFRKKKPLPKKLNICMVAEDFPLLGRAVDHGFLWPIAHGLAMSGHNVTILSWKNSQGKKQIEVDGVVAHFLGSNQLKDLDAFPSIALEKFKELHKKNNFNLVHSVDSSGKLIAKHKKRFKVAVAFDIEATHMSNIFTALANSSQENIRGLVKTSLVVAYTFIKYFLGGDRKILKSADGVFVTGPLQRFILERYYLYPEFRTYTVPYGIEIGDLSPREKSEEIRQKLGIPKGSHIVVTITDMCEFEEVKNLLRGFEKVAIKKASARFIIVGDGPLRKQIEYEMLNLALGSRVIFTGAISNVKLSDYIVLADAFVNISSRTTGFEPNLLEAMAQKKVIIGSEVSPMATIVDDGVDGFLIRPADIHSLSSLLIHLFAGEIDSENMGNKARQKVIDLFDKDKMLLLVLHAYYCTLENSGYYKRERTKWTWYAPKAINS